MTTVTVTADGLRHALTGMSKVISTKSKLPILTYVRLSVAEGCLELTSTDLDTTARCAVPVQVEGDTNFTPVCVSFSQLKKLVNGKNGKETGFSFVQSEKIIPPEKEGGEETRVPIIKLGYTLGGQRLEVKLESLPAEEFPPLPQTRGITFELDHYEIKSMLAALPFASTDESRYILNGVCLDGNRTENAIVATDGRRLQMFSNVFFPEGLTIIVTSQAKVLWWLAEQAEPDETWSVWYQRQLNDLTDDERKLIDESKNLEVKPEGLPEIGNTMTFTMKNWQVWVKEIEGNYPNYMQVVPGQDMPHTRIELGDDAIEFINNSMPALPENGYGRTEPTVCIHTEGDDVFLRVKMEDGPVGFKVPGARAVPVNKPDGEERKDVIACYNRRFLQEGLKGCFHTWILQDELSPLLMLGENKQHVLMPMRMP